MATRGALTAIVGLLLSGPVAVALLAMIRRSVGWTDAETFVRYFTQLQVAPFYFGFVLVFGYLMLFAGLHELAPDEARPRATVAAMLATAYGALITFNYLCQTTFVPAMVSRYRPAYEGLIDAFSIANPRSLAWALEMWGYALLGAATWFAAGIFRETQQERWLARLMVLNGIGSLAAAFAAAADMSWLTSTLGFSAYIGWNALMLVLMILIVLVVTPRRAFSA